VYEAIQKAVKEGVNAKIAAEALLCEYRAGTGASLQLGAIERLFSRYARSPVHVRREVALALWMAKRAISFDAIGDPLYKLFMKECNIEPASDFVLLNSVLPVVHLVVMEAIHEQIKSAESVFIAVDGWDGDSVSIGKVSWG
jgi:hypothetical protein